jgi:hypothetical protein
MKKAILFLLMFGIMSVYSESVYAQIGSDPSWMQGYNDGFDEGRRLALQGNYSLYQQYSNSYSTYPQRFPNHPENYPYFAGKYVGLYYGWEAFVGTNPPSGGGGGGGGGNGGDPSPSPSDPHEN